MREDTKDHAQAQDRTAQHSTFGDHLAELLPISSFPEEMALESRDASTDEVK